LPNQPLLEITAVILAGGRSQRMGTDKAWVVFREKPLLIHVLEQLTRLQPAQQIVICREAPPIQLSNVEFVPDIIPDIGPAGGLITALTSARHEHIIVAGCDMPFINPALYQKLLTFQKNQEQRFDAVIPGWQGKPQPLHGLYHRQCLDRLQTLVDSGTRRLTDILDGLNTCVVDETEYNAIESTGLAFTNLNTPDDLQRAVLLVENNRPFK
jgi:molybdenum cofactor guanylyltransferase